MFLGFLNSCIPLQNVNVSLKDLFFAHFASVYDWRNFCRPSINVFVTRALFCLNVLGKLFNHIQEIRKLPICAL